MIKGQRVRMVLRVDWVVGDAGGDRKLHITANGAGDVGLAAAPIANYLAQHPDVFGSDVAAAGKLLYEALVAAAVAHATGALKGEV